ncbi:unnamed protein product [Rotaria sordida]|uniref:Uncharacterized protein n=1 Tax=Rotaria sordida TaxID=392033 RepID=A0A815WUZ6_9BILA|nr:unnamed protein product [Rotaria sordida]CAF1547853.1 unnamed protein product [Rotaria sordida]
MHSRQMIHKHDGKFKEATDLNTKTLNKITTACQNGDVHILQTVLESIPLKKLGRYLNAMIEGQEIYTYVTPLMIASVHGHNSIVRFLLENYSHHCIVDAQNYSSYYDSDYNYDFEHFNKQTALWLAVRSKHLNVVRTLVSLGKANVNQKADYDYTTSNRTPLYLACFNGQLKMVKYLVENGADLYHTDKNDSTSLMIASHYGHDDIVQYLLSFGDSSSHLLNAVNNKGSTALHEAAGSGKLSTIKLFLEQYHAKIVKDNNGYTPLTIAGINNQQKLLNYFIENKTQYGYTFSEIIDELELIGSYHMINYIGPDPERAYDYLLWAMRLRYKVPKLPFFKNNLPSPIEAYEYCTECRTIKELESIRNNPNRMIIECLMIHERAGVTSNFLDLLDHQAELCGYDLNSINLDSDLGGPEECQLALRLWLHAYHLRIQTQINLNKCVSYLMDCTRIISELINSKRMNEIQFDILMKVLEATENEYLRNKNLELILDVGRENKNFSCSSSEIDETMGNNGDKCLYIILNLLFNAMKILRCNNKKTQERQSIIVQRVKKYIVSDWRTLSDNKTLLHLSLMEHHNSISVGICRRFPSLSIVQLLLSCRASINAIDCHHYTPLHNLASNKFKKLTKKKWDDIKKIFKLLINDGAHLDAIAQGKTPEDCTQHETLKSLFRIYPNQLSLKCLCARMIQKSQLNYMDYVPKALYTFIELH